jgi:transposase
MIAQWKRKAREELPEVFTDGRERGRQSREEEIKELHAKIGQLTIENDFLSKAFGR